MGVFAATVTVIFSGGTGPPELLELEDELELLELELLELELLELLELELLELEDELELSPPVELLELELLELELLELEALLSPPSLPPPPQAVLNKTNRLIHSREMLFTHRIRLFIDAPYLHYIFVMASLHEFQFALDDSQPKL